MIKITHIRETVSSYTEYLKRGRCEAQVNDFTKQWRARAGKDDLCERHALYLIDGKRFCKFHAGDYVLNYLLKQQ